jgi:hypothetical protein
VNYRFDDVASYVIISCVYDVMLSDTYTLCQLCIESSGCEAAVVQLMPRKLTPK